MKIDNIKHAFIKHFVSYCVRLKDFHTVKNGFCLSAIRVINMKRKSAFCTRVQNQAQMYVTFLI